MSKITAYYALLFGSLAVMAAAPAPKPLLPIDLGHVRYWRMYTGPDGNTAVAPLQWNAHFVNEFGSAHGIVQFFSEHAKSVVVISGKPGWVSPMHNVGHGRELVAVLGGSSIGHFANGRTQTFHTGDIVLVEDQGSKGRAVEFGKDGYLAVTVPLDDNITASPR